MDPRIGMCLDIGHGMRNWKESVDDLKKYHIRIFDIHLIDVTVANKLGYSLEFGQGFSIFPLLLICVANKVGLFTKIP